MYSGFASGLIAGGIVLILKNRKLLKEENIDAVDFLGLFYLSGVFDFDFIYSQIDEKLKREQIKSEIKAFRQDPKYKQFRDILDED